MVANTPSAELAARRGLGFFALLLPAACAALGSYSYGYGFAGSYSYGYGLAASRTRIAAVDESEGYHEQWTHEGLLFTCAPDARVTLARLGEFGAVTQNYTFEIHMFLNIHLFHTLVIKTNQCIMLISMTLFIYCLITFFFVFLEVGGRGSNP